LAGTGLGRPPRGCCGRGSGTPQASLPGPTYQKPVSPVSAHSPALRDWICRRFGWLGRMATFLFCVYRWQLAIITSGPMKPRHPPWHRWQQRLRSCSADSGSGGAVGGEEGPVQTVPRVPSLASLSTERRSRQRAGDPAVAPGSATCRPGPAVPAFRRTVRSKFRTSSLAGVQARGTDPTITHPCHPGGGRSTVVLGGRWAGPAEAEAEVQYPVACCLSATAAAELLGGDWVPVGARSFCFMATGPVDRYRFRCFPPLLCFAPTSVVSVPKQTSAYPVPP